MAATVGKARRLGTKAMREEARREALLEAARSIRRLIMEGGIPLDFEGPYVAEGIAAFLEDLAGDDQGRAHAS